MTTVCTCSELQLTAAAQEPFLSAEERETLLAIASLVMPTASELANMEAAETGAASGLSSFEGKNY